MVLGKGLSKKGRAGSGSMQAATGYSAKEARGASVRPKRTQTVRHAARGEQLKTKVSIAIDPEVLDWANRQAKQRALSLSAVFAAALEQARRNEDFDRALAAAGGTADITDQDMERVYAEWREHGLIA